MSTKIYNGYCINKNMSFYELNEYMRIIRETVQNKYEEIFLTKLKTMIIDIKDTKKILNDSEKFKKYLLGKYDISISDEQEAFLPFLELKNKKEDNQYFDYTCSIVIYPLKDKILFQLMTDNQEFIELFGYVNREGKLINGVFENITPYPYYNNVDRPKNISKKQWKQRGEEWNSVLKEIGIPALNGMLYELIDSNIFINKELFNSKIKQYSSTFLFNKLKEFNNFYTIEFINDCVFPNKELFNFINISLQDRIEKKAYSILLNSLVEKKFNEKTKNIEDNNQLIKIYSNIFKDIKTFLNQEEGLQLLKTEKERLYSILDENINCSIFEKIYID